MKKINKFIYWTPRILSIVFICFLALFSLDVIAPGLSFGQILLGLLMHNIPVLLLLIILLLSWKREIVGGIAFTLAGLSYIILLLINIIRDSSQWYMLFWTLPISAPAFLIGILFIINWRRKKNKSVDWKK